ncbi:MAG: VOC family protein [Bacteroidota bacterium]
MKLSLAILMTFSALSAHAQKKDKINYHIEGMTIAITNMEEMLKFYSEVFGIEFTLQKMFESNLYSGKWGDLNVLFCPASLAGNTAEQNRHQFDIVVSDLDKTIQAAVENGGKKMGEIVEDDASRSIGIYDPDKNSILFKEVK